MNMRYGLASVMLAVFMASQVMAADVRWDNGGADAKWSTAANWDTDTLPTSADAAKVGYDWTVKNATSVVDQAGAQANALYLADGVTTTGELQIVSGGELQVGNLIYVGYSGDGTITMTGGSLLVTNNINFGYFGGGSGANIIMSGGYINCDQISASWNSPGKMVQSGGTNVIRTQLQMGWNPGVLAEYELSGGLLKAGEVRIGAYLNSVGEFTISGGVLDLTGHDFNIGHWSTSTGTCTIAGGSVTSANCRVGYSGTGFLTQTGGTNSVDTELMIGGYGTSTGTYSLCGGVLELAGSKMYVSKSIYEQASSGTFLMGNANGTGILRQKGATSTGITVCDTTNAVGLIHGWGKVELTGQLNNNGRIIADGYGADRDLCFTNMSRATISFENSDTNGWYAQNHGRLLLPPTFNWYSPAIWGGGGTYGFSDYKAINSVKFDWAGGAKDSVTGALLAGDHGSVPAGLVDIIGCWEFSGVDNNSTLTFIYDAALATNLGINESELHAWRYNGSKWINVTAVGGLDVTSNTITTVSVDANAYFAIATGPAKGTTIIIK